MYVSATAGARLTLQIHTINGDSKCHDLVALLERDRARESTTPRQQIAYRMEAEELIGTDDSLYRVEYVRAAEYHPVLTSAAPRDQGAHDPAAEQGRPHSRRRLRIRGKTPPLVAMLVRTQRRDGRRQHTQPRTAAEPQPRPVRQRGPPGL